LLIIFDNHRPLPQYAEHDPAEEQWRCDAADQSTKYRYPSTPFLEPQFARKPDDPHQWDARKYLEDAKLIKVQSQENQQETQKGLKKTHISAARTLAR
jgi:hypothetical protein